MSTPFSDLDPSSNTAMWTYNALDCVFTRECGEAEARAVRDLGLEEVDKFQHQLFPAVLHAMLRGVKIDLERRAKFSGELAAGLREREKWFEEVIGHPINMRSPKQMMALFYEDLRLPTVWKKDATGKRVATLGKTAYPILDMKEPLVRPLTKCIREVRSLGVFKSSFVDAALDIDGRMRCSYNICGTETYRFSSSKNAFGTGTNMANVPMGGDNAEDDEEFGGLTLPNVRTLFIPDTDQTFFDLDLSKADLRIVVKESECSEMQAMLDEGRDPYVETAREFYKDPSINKARADGQPDPKYKMFKSFCHGTHYLGTPQGLSQRLGLTVHEATRTQAWYFGRYAAIKRWQERFIEEVKATHRVRNKFGYVRHYFGRIDDSTYREAIAWLPQSTVAIYINKIWVALFNSGAPIEVLIQVHDSLAGQFPTAKAGEAVDAIRRLAKVVIPYPEPLTIPIGLKTSTTSWGDCG